MIVSNESIAMVMDLVRPALLESGHYTKARGMLQQAIRDCKNQNAARAAQILLNDYEHLRDGGCHPYVAMKITLTHPKDLK